MGSKSDASKKILGFKYQEMVALKECFEAKDGLKIFLECFGDISDGVTSTEVKHSIDEDKNLINTHIDFWKTLSNIIDDYDNFRFYNKFILHTTAKIKKGSIFENWINDSADEKVKKLLEVKSNDTIKKYFENVKNSSSEALKNIINKFEIKDNQKSAKDYYAEILLEHSAIINNVAMENRESFICSLLGYISTELITAENYQWRIDIDNFRENFQVYANHYRISDLKFPISKIEADSDLKDNFHFVKELERIRYDSVIGVSMKNYLRANDSQIKMINTRKSLIENLENYDEEIFDIADETKYSHIDQLTDTCDKEEKSRRYFDATIDKVSTKTKIEGITQTSSYYPKGRFLYNIENRSLNLNLRNESE